MSREEGLSSHGDLQEILNKRGLLENKTTKLFCCGGGVFLEIFGGGVCEGRHLPSSAFSFAYERHTVVDCKPYCELMMTFPILLSGAFISLTYRRVVGCEYASKHRA